MRHHLIQVPVRVLAASLAAICAVGVLVACTGDTGPTSVLGAFLRGWPQGKLDNVELIDAKGSPISAGDVVAAIRKLSGDLAPAAIRLSPAGSPKVIQSDATAAVDVDWTVSPAVTWHYQTTVRLNQKNNGWRVVWSPDTVHPDLLTGDALALRTIATQRGQILDRAGAAIVKPRPVVVVGVAPKSVRDQRALYTALDTALRSVHVSIDFADVRHRVGLAKPDAFVEVVTLRRETYDQIRAQIHDLPGVVFDEQTRDLAPTRAFARALLGTVGPVRKDQLDANPGKYAIGDQVGQSGLQLRYDDIMRGADGVAIVIGGRGTDPAPELFRRAPKLGAPLRTRLDQGIQNAADAALAGQSRRAAVVAIRISDGSVVAVANGPDGGELNLAFTAAVPPGSTFKMVSALGLLDVGAVGLDTLVNCPRGYPVNGREFTNANSFELGLVKFRVDFAKSCNTAFASLAPRLGPDGLRKTAASLGLGVPWTLGPDVFTGSVDANLSDVEAAAATFGQGTTQVSPVAMASAVAAVAGGRWQPPTLFAEQPGTGSSAGTGSSLGTGPSPGGSGPTAVTLNSASVAALRTMMREVVTSGTGTALAGLPGGAVYAKTGTAEFDNDPRHTHAWTVGWQGDIAFAVFVENGGSSSATALPIVASFLRGLA